MINEEIEEWINKANSDLRIVGHELQLPEEEIVKDAVCFHCQQSVEKLLHNGITNGCSTTAYCPSSLI